MGSEHICAKSSLNSSAQPYILKWRKSSRRFKLYDYSTRIQASQSMEDKNKVYKELGMFSLRKKIEDSVLRAETLGPMALEVEEEGRIQQEEMVRHYDLWDDLAHSNEILMKLADSSKVVDSLKDLRYKAEEAKLITELADMDVINYGLFEQAYSSSQDVSKFLDEYEISKLLNRPFDKEGACLTITAANSGLYPEIWAEQLLRLYMRWAKKQGLKGRVVEKCSSTNCGIKSATIEFESKYAYGYLLGERGVHCMISSSHEASTAVVEITPLFLNTVPKLPISDEDLSISSPSSCAIRSELEVRVQHIPSGLTIQSSGTIQSSVKVDSYMRTGEVVFRQRYLAKVQKPTDNLIDFVGERNRFANKIKALNRLKAKLLVNMRDQGVSDVSSLDKNGIIDIWDIQARRYIFHPQKLVQDVKTGIQMPDLNSVLDGNIEHLIAANINIRQTF